MVNVIFLHPDLGIGGAERLVVDAAMALKQRGHNVSFLTNHHDPQHCFEETINGQLKVQTVGDWLPRQIMGRFYAACAYLRMIYLAFYAAFFLARREKVDVFFCDQISVCIPVLRFAVGHPRIVFYCHYPDQLLSVPEGRLKRLYRAPLDYFEELTVGMADTILVNSKFTRGVFHQTFRRLRVEPGVLYPSLNAQNFDDMLKVTKDFNVKHGTSDMPQVDPSMFIFFDINRYERKKNHELAIYAFQAMLKLLSPAEQAQCQLVIAGGYDTQNAENCSHYEELHDLLQKLQLSRQVVLLKSPKDNEKFMLLKAAGCVIYTPANEHFGIVPLEAMYMSKPVIAVNSGGPTETIVHNSTGILCEPEPKLFAAAMAKLLKDDKLRVDMGMKGHRRVQEEFSYKVFGDKLEQFILKSDAKPKKL